MTLPKDGRTHSGQGIVRGSRANYGLPGLQIDSGLGARWTCLVFPCRHHIYELVLRQVYEFYMGETKSDKVRLFVDFRKSWDGINKENYIPGIDEPEVAKILTPEVRANIKSFITSKMENKIFRYVESFEIKFLMFHPTGADHHARWMSKGIYSQNISLYKSDQASITFQIIPYLQFLTNNHGFRNAKKKALSCHVSLPKKSLQLLASAKIQFLRKQIWNYLKAITKTFQLIPNSDLFVQ